MSPGKVSRSQVEGSLGREYDQGVQFNFERLNSNMVATATTSTVAIVVRTIIRAYGIQKIVKH